MFKNAFIQRGKSTKYVLSTLLRALEQFSCIEGAIQILYVIILYEGFSFYTIMIIIAVITAYLVVYLCIIVDNLAHDNCPQKCMTIPMASRKAPQSLKRELDDALDVNHRYEKKLKVYR